MKGGLMKLTDLPPDLAGAIVVFQQRLPEIIDSSNVPFSGDTMRQAVLSVVGALVRHIQKEHGSTPDATELLEAGAFLELVLSSMVLRYEHTVRAMESSNSQLRTRILELEGKEDG